MKTFFILDGYSLIYKSYFAFMRTPMKNPAGENSSAVFGFFRTLFSFFDKYRPEYFLVALDSLTPTFRHEMYPEYKATRDKTPDDLHAQIPRIEAILKAMNIGMLRVNGYEADDIIATLASACGEKEFECRIITGDKDLLQLVSGCTKVIRSSKDEYREFDRTLVAEEWGVEPEKILDYLALCGDTADNIPGVRGIGPKSAVSLINEYGGIEGIYENLDKIKGAVRTKLETARENCFLSRRLAELNRQVPVECSPEDFPVSALDYRAAVPLLQQEGIKSAVKWLETRAAEQGTDAPAAGPEVQAEAEIPAARGTYTAVTELRQLDALLDRVKEAGIYAIDLETDSLDVITNRPVGFSFAVKGGEGFYIPVRCQGKSYIPEEIIRNKLRSVIENPELKAIGQNIKFDYQVLRRWGLKPANIWFDTMVAAWLADLKISNYGMDYLADHYFGYRTIRYSEVVPKDKTFEDVPLEQATEYAAEDADITFRLYEKLLPMVQKYEKLFFEVEMPLVTILGDMELEGIRIEKRVLERYSAELENKLGEVEQEIFRECGREFNINSTQQLQEILFTDRKLKPVKKTKTGYSTDTSVLEELAAEDIVPELILKYRSLAKLKSTYVDALPLLTDSSSRLHTTFRQTGTATGRLSSINPNLQNIPVRDEEGRRIRKAFTARAGMKFLSADYAQIELVVLAHLSGDPELVKAFTEGTDVHRLTASLIFGVSPEEVTPEQRRTAKVINFGVIYGMSAFRLSKELGIPVQKASGFINLYFEKYAGIRSFIEETLKQAREFETVKTILGRERFIDAINSSNHNERSGAERMAFNSPIQGSAADIVKTAMINISKRIRKESLDAVMVLQIHDELIFEAPEREIATLKDIVREEMENVIKLRVPLRVSIETADSWGDMH